MRLAQAGAVADEDRRRDAGEAPGSGYSADDDYTADDYDYADDDDYEYADEEDVDPGAAMELPAAEDPDVDYSDVEEMKIIGTQGQLIKTDAAESAVQFDASDLEALGATDVSDIAKVTPNLEITVAGATSANFFIRGVGLADYGANSASAVAVYRDNVPLNSSVMQFTPIFDSQSVAVLRGPQGTGSARNASAGAIRIESRKPTGETQAQLRTTLGAYASPDARKALLQAYEGALEIPIVGDLLSTRLSFQLIDRNPFMTNGCGDAPLSGREPRIPVTRPKPEYSICGESVPPRQVSSLPAGLPSNVGDRGEWAARGIFRLQPDSLDMDWLLNVHGSRLDQFSTLGQAMGTGGGLGRTVGGGYVEPDQNEEFLSYLFGLGLPNDVSAKLLAHELASGRPLDIRPFRGDYNRVGLTTRDTWGVTLDGEMFFDDVPLLGPVTLQSITSYDAYKRSRDTDQDFTPLVLFELIQEDRAWQAFQELKATGESGDGAFRWEAGGYFLAEELSAETTQLSFRASRPFLRNFSQGIRSFAVYGGFGWDFLEDFTLDVGVRYNWEQKDFDFLQNNGLATLQVADPQQATWTAPTGLLSLTYRFTEDFSAYWKYSRGWKGGHFNANRANEPPAQPETLDSVEAGFNGSFFDARLAIDGTIFYYKYKNYQVFLFENAAGSPPILEVINANDAEQYGAELELNALPLRDWTAIPERLSDLELTLRAGWLESRFLDFTNQVEVQDGLVTKLQTVTYTGNRLPNAPEFKISGTVTWPFDFGRFGSLTPRYDFDWTDDIFFGPNNGRGTINVLGEVKPPLTVGQGAYTRHNLRLTWRDEEQKLEVSAWVRNLTDQRYKTFAFDASLFAAVVINFVGEPRTAGIDFSFRF